MTAAENPGRTPAVSNRLAISGYPHMKDLSGDENERIPPEICRDQA